MGTWLETTQRRWRSDSRNFALRKRLWSQTMPLDIAPEDFTPWIKPYTCSSKDLPPATSCKVLIPKAKTSPGRGNRRKVVRELAIPRTSGHSPTVVALIWPECAGSRPHCSLPASPVGRRTEKSPNPSFTCFDTSVIPVKPGKLLSLEQLRSYVRLRSQPKFR